MNGEEWRFKIYLAGYSRDLEYRKIAIEKYGDKLILIDPMNITWDEVYSNVGKELSHVWLIKRDKKLIDSCDILVAKVEYLPQGEIMVGTIMEIMYANEHVIPVFLISSEEKIRNNAWFKFHYRKAFETIEDCFDYIVDKRK